MNRHKGASVGILDPFNVGLGWFAIDFPQCDVILGIDIPHAMQSAGRFTIEKLKLNSEELVEDRACWAVRFRDGWTTLAFVKEQRPFLAGEIERQGSAKGLVDEADLRLFIARLFLKRPS